MHEIIEIDGRTFAVSEDCVREVGTLTRYDPRADRGYMEEDGRRISMCSYGMFGDDFVRAGKLARRWCDTARRAWEIAHDPNHQQRAAKEKSS